MIHLKNHHTNIDCSNSVYGNMSDIPFIFHDNAAAKTYYSGLYSSQYNQDTTPFYILNSEIRSNYDILEYIENTGSAIVTLSRGWANYLNVDLVWKQTALGNCAIIRNNKFRILNNRYTSNGSFQDFCSINIYNDSNTLIVNKSIHSPTNIKKERFVCYPYVSSENASAFDKYHVEVWTDGVMTTSNYWNISTPDMLNYTESFINLFRYSNMAYSKARFFEMTTTDADYKKLQAGGQAIYVKYLPARQRSTNKLGVLSIQYNPAGTTITNYIFDEATGDGMIAGPPRQPVIG